MKSRIHFMTLAAVLVLTACSGNNDNPADTWLQTLPESIRGLSGIEKFRTPIDYAEADNWLNVPATIDKDVDVFFIYPTCYLPQEATDPAVCDIDHAGMREGAQRMFRIQPSMEQFFGPQCYHGWDYGLFYLNLRKNIADRIAAWKGNT